MLWHYWLLREFKTRYAGSVLGVAWAFVPAFGHVGHFFMCCLVWCWPGTWGCPGLDVNNGYLLHLLAGLAVWLPFTGTLGRGVGSLAAYEDFLRKQPMPAECACGFCGRWLAGVGYWACAFVGAVCGAGCGALRIVALACRRWCWHTARA